MHALLYVLCPKDGVNSSSEARNRVYNWLIDEHFVGEGVMDAGDGLPSPIFFCLRQEQGKLVAGYTSQDVSGTNLVLDVLCHRSQDPVTRAVTQKVIDRLEVIEIDINKGEGAFITPEASDLEAGQLIEIPGANCSGDEIGTQQIEIGSLRFSKRTAQPGDHRVRAQPDQNIQNIDHLVRIGQPAREIGNEPSNGAASGDKQPCPAIGKPGSQENRDQVEEGEIDFVTG